MNKVALVAFWDSSPFKYYGYEIPFLTFGLKDGDFVIVPVGEDLTVAKIKMIIPKKDFVLNSPNVKLKKIIKKIDLNSHKQN